MPFKYLKKIILYIRYNILVPMVPSKCFQQLYNSNKIIKYHGKTKLKTLK